MRISDWSSDVCSSDLFASNLLALDGRALDPILTHYGRRSVPVDATCATDALPAMTGAVHKLVSTIAPHSDEGVNLSRRQLLVPKNYLGAGYDAIGALLTRIEASERGAPQIGHPMGHGPGRTTVHK